MDRQRGQPLNLKIQSGPLSTGFGKKTAQRQRETAQRAQNCLPLEQEILGRVAASFERQHLKGLEEALLTDQQLNHSVQALEKQLRT
jgi:hypothetical protein